ncbi:MAG: hypothetical protein M1816_002073 [Peltula sp. TS41687]|nr:MAG: hypothetical protein M1816_002073 [Peltula sp. TS41687]
MVSLWGSKYGEDTGDHSDTATPHETEPSEAGTGTGAGVGAPHGTGHGTGRDTAPRRHYRPTREPDERTRLLIPPREHGHFLSPDDPAVTPLNLWSVRFLRALSILFLLISFIWWIVVLVSLFATPPGLHTRGSGFFIFSFATLTVGNLLVAVLFYASPNKAQRVSCLIIAVLLLVDVILILTIPRLRQQEGWVGIATAGWATLVAIWTVITDRVVAWGKREEEERLTGRVETRRTLGEWCVVFISAIVLIVLIVVVVLITGTLILRAKDAGLTPPGKRYYVNNYRYQVHLYCEGYKRSESEPTVLLEAGEMPVETGLASFAADAFRNGTIGRYCYWDRPGFAFSDNAPSPLSAGMAADALSEALARAGEDGPWILVSAGVGSIYSRIFASRHANDIKGIMLVDGLHENLLHRVGAPGRGFIIWARGVLSPLGIDRLFGAIFKGRSREDRIYGRSSYQDDRFLRAKLQENLVANSLTKNEISSARTIQSRETQLVVISSGMEIRRDKNWERAQRDLTKLTDKLIAWDIVNYAPHEIWETPRGRKTMETRLCEIINKTQSPDG